jgi:lysophospholipase L1-like esterase
VTLLIFFGGIEFGLRLTGIDRGVPKTPPIYRVSADPAVTYELRPNMRETAFRSTVITDSRGFRSKEADPALPTIAVLGDSISFGYGIENNETIAARLGELVGAGFNVINAAAPGYSLAQEAAFYRNNVASLNPTTLVLQFHWNDLTGDPPNVLDAEGNLRPPSWTPSAMRCNPLETGLLRYLPARCWLDLHSAFYRTVKKVVSRRTEKQNEAQQVQQAAAGAVHDYVTDAQLAAYERTLSAFARTLPRSTKKLFIIWPERPLHLQSVPRLEQAAARAGFRTLNLYEIFGNNAETLSWDTVHPSAKTAKTAAIVIDAALREWNLLPSQTP